MAQPASRIAATDAARSPLFLAISAIALFVASSTDCCLHGCSRTFSKSFRSVLRLLGKGFWASRKIFAYADSGQACNGDDVSRIDVSSKRAKRIGLKL